MIDSDGNSTVEKDYRTVRNNYIELMQKTSESLDNLLMLASDELASPKDYDAVAKMIRTAAAVNNGLVNLHKEEKTFRAEQNTLHIENQQNILTITDTADLNRQFSTKTQEVKDAYDVKDEDVVEAEVVSDEDKIEDVGVKKIDNE